MSQNEKKDRPDEVGNVEVEPLTDSDLESVAGGDGSVQEIGVVNNVSTGCQVTNNATTGC